MNNALTFLLTIAILAGAAAYSITNRYKVVQGANVETVIIDNWDFKNQRFIEKKASGNWYAVDVIKGGKEVMKFEETVAKTKNDNLPPAI